MFHFHWEIFEAEILKKTIVSTNCEVFTGLRDNVGYFSLKYYTIYISEEEEAIFNLYKFESKQNLKVILLDTIHNVHYRNSYQFKLSKFEIHWKNRNKVEVKMGRDFGRLFCLWRRQPGYSVFEEISRRFEIEAAYFGLQSARREARSVAKWYDFRLDF